MQIALDTVVYILLSLMLFSLVLAFLPKVEELSYAYVKEDIKLSKEEVVNKVIDVMLNRSSSATVILKEEITRDELEERLIEAGLEDQQFQINFNSSASLSIVNIDGVVVING